MALHAELAKLEGATERNEGRFFKGTGYANFDGRDFMAVIRLYGADIAFFDQTWKPDDVVKVK